MMKSIGFDKRTWMTGNGWYHRDQVRVFERRRLPSLNYLEYQFMIDDPKRLTRRWTSSRRRGAPSKPSVGAEPELRVQEV
jgi:hypothetical protein